MERIKEILAGVRNWTYADEGCHMPEGTVCYDIDQASKETTTYIIGECEKLKKEKWDELEASAKLIPYHYGTAENPEPTVYYGDNEFKSYCQALDRVIEIFKGGK